MRERLCAALIAMTLAWPVLAANPPPLPPALTAQQSDFALVGEGRMRWFGLLLYDATLWAGDGRWTWERPFALDLRYARDFVGAKLAEASVDEMKRLGHTDAALLQKWRDYMVDAFPDVRKGERITGVYRPGEGVEFFHQGRSTAVVRDPAFGRAFFSIWLDPRTREPKLRAALLGRS